VRGYAIPFGDCPRAPPKTALFEGLEVVQSTTHKGLTPPALP